MSTFKVVQTSQGDVQIRSVREQDALARGQGGKVQVHGAIVGTPAAM